ncbi:MAG: Mu-like prophage major head subunit gpT family protein [Alkalilacustris sp.]
MIDTRQPIKPIILQWREALQFTALNRPDDPEVFMNDKYLFGARSRMNVGFGLWQMAYASRETLNAANYAAAREAMMGFQAAGGRKLGIRPNLLPVPPSLESAGRKLLNSELGQGGESNEWKGTAELLVTPWLS